MFTILQLPDFRVWLLQLADMKAKARVLARIRSAGFGNFGDCKPVGEGVFEMRIHTGPGYRVYYTQTGGTVYLLLTGGNKGSQDKDIKRAKLLAQRVQEEKE